MSRNALPSVWMSLCGQPGRSSTTDVIAMPDEINAGELQELLDGEDAQLVEVLPRREYEEEHLPGALNIPLKSFTPERLSQLDRNRPVVVYCWVDD